MSIPTKVRELSQDVFYGSSLSERPFLSSFVRSGFAPIFPNARIERDFHQNDAVYIVPLNGGGGISNYRLVFLLPGEVLVKISDLPLYIEASMKDIRYLLTAWGNWSGSRIGTEYKAAWPLMQQQSDIRPMLSDEDGERVDRAVSRLKVFDPLGYDIVIAYYRGKLSCRAIAGCIKRHYTFVSKILEKAEAYIAGWVESILDVA